MLGFPLDAPRALLDEMAFWSTVADALGASGVVDEGFAKTRGELLVAGSFFAPGGIPLPASYVRAKVGAADKRLAVVGDRLWKDHAATEPEPMASMPIDWVHAFGGPRFDRNPYGKGTEPLVSGGRVIPLPNVDHYGAMLRAPDDRPEPAGFLPMDVTFVQRRARAGTYDQHWLEEHFPGLAPDVAPTFFNVAPEDQWIDGFFRGDEAILVENMHPERPRIEGRLPGLAARCFVTQRTPEGERFPGDPAPLGHRLALPVGRRRCRDRARHARGRRGRRGGRAAPGLRLRGPGVAALGGALPGCARAPARQGQGRHRGAIGQRPDAAAGVGRGAEHRRDRHWAVGQEREPARQEHAPGRGAEARRGEGDDRGQRVRSQGLRARRGPARAGGAAARRPRRARGLHGGPVGARGHDGRRGKGEGGEVAGGRATQVRGDGGRLRRDDGGGKEEGSRAAEALRRGASREVA